MVVGYWCDPSAHVKWTLPNLRWDEHLRTISSDIFQDMKSIRAMAIEGIDYTKPTAIPVFELMNSHSIPMIFHFFRIKALLLSIQHDKHGLKKKLQFLSEIPLIGFIGANKSPHS